MDEWMNSKLFNMFWNFIEQAITVYVYSLNFIGYCMLPFHKFLKISFSGPMENCFVFCNWVPLDLQIICEKMHTLNVVFSCNKIVVFQMFFNDIK